MRRKYTYLFIYLFIYLFNYGQVNLVPNPSFEDTVGSNCWEQMGISNYSATSALYVKDWYSVIGTPDFFNICANSIVGFPVPNSSSVPYNCEGFQKPKTGNCYVGFLSYVKPNLIDSINILTEPFSVKLKKPLISGHCYFGEFYVSLANMSNIATNQISLLCTQNVFTTSIGSFTNTIQPQIQWDTTTYFTDTLNWVKVSGKFIAQGGEQYLTISNFKDGLHLKKQFVNGWSNPTTCGITLDPGSYIYVDDVALYELPTPQLEATNYTICNNSDSLVLGDTARLQTAYQWFANGAPISTSNTISVKPTQTTNYVLQSTQCGVTSQTITVTYSTNCEPVVVTEPVIPNVFTPNNDNVNDTFEFTVSGATNLQFTVYNRWGLEISNDKSEIKNKVIWSGYTTSGEPCNAGIYFYVLTYKDANGDENKKNGYISLIK